MENWETFEELSRRIAEELTPFGSVTRNEKLMGRSGVVHQCDVVVRVPAGDAEIVCVIECKDTAARVDLDTVRGAFARVHDLGASGVIVSRNGFTSEAAAFAKAYSIRIYQLAEALSVKWAQQALLPMVVTFASLGQVEFEMRVARTKNRVLFRAGSDQGAIRLYDVTEQKEITVGALIESKWDEHVAAGPPGEEISGSDTTGQFAVAFPSGLEAVEITYVLRPQKVVCYNRIPLSVGRGFVEHRTNEVFLGNEFETGFVELEEVWKSWPRAPKREDVPYSGIVLEARVAVRRTPRPDGRTIEAIQVHGLRK